MYTNKIPDNHYHSSSRHLTFFSWVRNWFWNNLRNVIFWTGSLLLDLLLLVVSLLVRQWLHGKTWKNRSSYMGDVKGWVRAETCQEKKFAIRRLNATSKFTNKENKTKPKKMNKQKHVLSDVNSQHMRTHFRCFAWEVWLMNNWWLNTQQICYFTP